MRRLGNWSMILASLAFTALPLLAAGCAENQASSSPETSDTSTTSTPEESGSMEDDLGDLGELPDDLGDPAEAGSGLGLPEAGSALE